MNLDDLNYLDGAIRSESSKLMTKYNPEYADLPFNADVETEQNDINPERLQELCDRRNEMSEDERHLIGDEY